MSYSITSTGATGGGCRQQELPKPMESGASWWLQEMRQSSPGTVQSLQKYRAKDQGKRTGQKLPERRAFQAKPLPEAGQGRAPTSELKTPHLGPARSPMNALRCSKGFCQEGFYSSPSQHSRNARSGQRLAYRLWPVTVACTREEGTVSLDTASPEGREPGRCAGSVESPSQGSSHLQGHSSGAEAQAFLTPQ